MTATEYSPVASVRREMVFWHLPTRRVEWKWPDTGGATDFALEGTFSLAISTTGRRLAALLSIGWRPELWVWDRDAATAKNPLLRVQTPQVTKVYPVTECPKDGTVQFRSNNAVVWCEDRQVEKRRTVRLSQGWMDVPVEPGWTVQKAELTASGPQITDLGSSIGPDDWFLAFSADGIAFLTWNSESATLRLWPTHPAEAPLPLQISGDSKRDFAELATVFFRKGREWQKEGEQLVGRWPNGSSVAVTGERVEFHSGKEQWNVRDPRLTPSADNRRWHVEKQHIISVSRSGQLIATVSIEGLTGQERYGHLVRLWDSATGAPVSQWLWHESQILDASFSDDGWIWTLTAEGRVRRWPADTADLQTADWIDAIAEPASGMRLLSVADVSALDESELTTSRWRFRQQLEAAARGGDQLARWFLRRFRTIQ